MKSIKQNVNCQKGVAALLTVIIVGAAVLVMAYAASILGQGDLEISVTQQQGSETLAIAEGCADEAMRRLRLDASYAGSTLNLGSGSCTIGVVSSGDDRTITVDADIGSKYYKSVEVGLTLSGDQTDIITVTSWQEISN